MKYPRFSHTAYPGWPFWKRKMKKLFKAMPPAPNFQAEHGPVSATELGIKAGRYSLDENGEWQWSNPDEAFRTSLRKLEAKP